MADNEYEHPDQATNWTLVIQPSAGHKLELIYGSCIPEFNIKLQPKFQYAFHYLYNWP